ncbi:NADPH:quinone reductase-like Zn-dependent oxidoreductase [Microbacterium sp. W4I4]|uniref:NAD(P)-dependent alcohol dehydrogenase n=1 Tax=Microbacterium sp. W4I4 TaxID=3042295 RepID=UPI002780FB00|nr:NAD(P)-dependent alcohol dehydrogenase [Microbacterium sp. W4I4]MDQ0615191.1 NADPH:quinone reductase-like Zn-dependent oxidoreductase [Microbacterium sp. W4I4]
MTITAQTMPAWVQAGYGPASATRLAERDVPAPGAGEVLLRVRATALNSGDIRLMRGEPGLVRLAFGLTRPRIPVRGMDVAATVIALGDGVTDAAVGDEVVVELPGGGGLAPFVVAPAERLVARPASVDPDRAACLPIAAGTAWQALELSGLREGGRVLILGASGGVGTFIVQLAAHRGAEVHATCGDRNRALVARLGATRVLARDQPVHELAEGSYDAVIDLASTARLRDLQRATRNGGTIVLVGGDGTRVLGPIGRMLRAVVLSIGSRRRIRPLAAVAKPDVLRELLTLVAAGSIDPVIQQTYPFGEAGAALAHVEAGHTVGKVVVRVAS